MNPRTQNRYFVLAVGSVLVGVILLGIVVSTGATIAQTEATQQTSVASAHPSIEDVSYSGEGVVRVDDENAYAFQDEPATIAVDLDPGIPAKEYKVCLEGYPDQDDEDVESDPVELGCSELTPTKQSPATTTLEVDVEEWPEELVDEREYAFVIKTEEEQLIGTEEREVLRENRSIHVIEKEGDLSNNGLTNEEELQHGTDFTVSDTTRSGLNDHEEIHTYETDPLATDTDSDGIPDAIEVLIGTDPTDPRTTPLLLGVAAVPIMLLVGVSGMLLRRWRVIGPAPSGDPNGSAPPESGDVAATRGESVAGEQPTPPSGGEPPVDERPEADVPLTDKDRVLQILGQHSGRIRQQEIVSQTGWSKSKVSRLLSKMEDDEQISKISVGRENLITFDDAEPDAAKSPFDSPPDADSVSEAESDPEDE